MFRATEKGTTPRHDSLQRRMKERAAGAIFEAVTRSGNLRPTMLPAFMLRQLNLLGAREDQLQRVTRRMRSIADWPYVWEDEGDRSLALNDHLGAYAAYYAAQRVLLEPSNLKDRLYHLAVSSYTRLEQPRIERLDVHNERGERIAFYLQFPRASIDSLPSDTAKVSLPCILMLPGVTGTKEELHAYAMPFLERGLAVARMDHPVYGETEGLLDATSITNAEVVYSYLQKDPRIDANQIHLHGMSLGAHFTLQNALIVEPASTTVICPPVAPHRYLRELPASNITAVKHMTGLTGISALSDFAKSLSMRDSIDGLVGPLRVFHGGRDHTIPVDESLYLAERLPNQVALTIYERDHHNCLEHFHEITAETLEFIRDTDRVLRAAKLHSPVEPVHEFSSPVPAFKRWRPLHN